MTELESAGRLELSAPATPEMIELVHALLEQLFAGLSDVTPRDRFRFESAVIEVVGNIVEHAYRLDGGQAAERRFDVSVAASDRALVAAFGDNGVPVALDLSDISMPDFEAESGRGLAMAAAAVDDLVYERVEGRNHWRLTCLRHAD